MPRAWGSSSGLRQGSRQTADPETEGLQPAGCFDLFHAAEADLHVPIGQQAIVAVGGSNLAAMAAPGAAAQDFVRCRRGPVGLWAEALGSQLG